MERRQLSDYTLGGDIYTSLSPAAAAEIASQLGFSTGNGFPLPGQWAKTYGGEDMATAVLSSQFPTAAAQSTPIPDDQVTGNSVATGTASYGNILASTTVAALWPTDTNNVPIAGNSSNLLDNHGWADMAGGAHIGVIVSTLIGIVLIVLFSFWFCCGGRAWWSRHHNVTNSNSLPLYTIGGRNTQVGVHREAEGGGDAPPMYAEVAPPQHQTVAGGMRDANEVQRLEEEAAVVSDGKTPLSEIPFEDVVLERYVSESESSGSLSRGFEQRHHAMGGDTTGHTNT